MTARRASVAAIVAMVVGFAVLHAAGARACVGVLLGTAAGDDCEVVAGGAYLLAWFGVVLASPVLALALTIDAVCGKLVRRVRAWRSSHPR